MQVLDSERLNLNPYDVLTYINTTYIYISLKSKTCCSFGYDSGNVFGVKICSH